MLQLTFTSESDQFEHARQEYADIWNEEQEKILRSFKEITSLDFKQKEIEVVVYEGPSFSGRINTPMKLRASYSREVKQGTLVHELGHRLIAPLHNRITGVDEHQTLNLFLYDVWINLYGKDFADQMVLIESKRTGLYSYEKAWKWFFSLNEPEKNRIWKNFLDLNSD